MGKKNLSLVECSVVNCRDVEDLVGPYLDGDLVLQLAERFDAHLGECAACRQLVEDLQIITATAKTLSDKPVPADISRRLRTALSEKLGIEMGPPKPQLALLKSSVLKPE